MEEKSNSDSDSTLRSSNICEDMREGWYPMYVGVSCALFALKLLSGRDSDNDKWSELCSKLEAAERKIEELHRIRHEDAKANEKVVGIFASQEQNWFNERKKLRQHIGGLVNELRVVGRKKDHAVSELNRKLNEIEALVYSKDKVLEEEEIKRKKVEENLNKAENLLEEMREAAKRVAQEHSKEIWKHKTAFIELVSNQRQLEAEMGRALRQVEATKHELGSVLEQKAESIMMVQKLSAEMVKMQKDVEQKDKILSAMLRKSKLDTAEKQMLLKEVKLSKAKRKPAELEKDRLRSVSEVKHGGRSLRNMFQTQVGSRKAHSSATASSHSEGPDVGSKDSPLSDYYPHEENGEQVIASDVELENWVHMEAEKYASLIEQRHRLEMEAFVEQMRLKDEKLEAFRWRLLSMEIESKRLRSHVEGLNKDIAQLRHSNMKMEALLLEREEELSSLKEKIQGAVWSKVKIVKRTAEREKIIESLAESCLEDNGDEVEETSSTGNPKDSNLMVESIEKSSLPSQPLSKTSYVSWRMDLHALGVSYKIKRLNQQLLMLERLIGKQGSSEEGEHKEGNLGTKGVVALISLLNKQVIRYQSLQEKTDDLCKRMHENDPGTQGRDSTRSASRNKGQTKTLEHFLEETFQLQRYMVATGQKLTEIQSKVAAWFSRAAEEVDGPSSFDMKRFSDSLRTLFQEVQRGLDVRISRIIGDLEGPLAFDGITHLRR